MMWLKNCFNILVILTITAAKISSENNYQTFSWNKISDDDNEEAIKNKVVANFHKFLNSKTVLKDSEVDSKEEKTATHWELIQKKRIDDIATLFNSSFVPYKDYFNFTRITGLDHGEKPSYHIGTFGGFVTRLLKSLPGESWMPRLTSLWKYFSESEEKSLYTRLEQKIRNGETLYTNRRRDGGFLFRLFETNGWWHRAMAFCTSHKIDQFSPEDDFCDVAVNFGLTLLIKLVVLRDLGLCALATLVTGDTSLCLALVLSKLVWPGWTGDRETPWIAHNVHT